MTIGGDPEFFFVDKKGNVVPSEKLLPWKEKPMKVEDRFGYSLASLHADGIQGEMTLHYNKCRGYVSDYCWYGLRAAHNLAKKNGLSILLDAAIHTPKSLLDTVSPRGKEFGCDPDFIAWLDGIESPPMPPPDDHEFRYSGGHIHFGFPTIETMQREIAMYNNSYYKVMYGWVIERNTKMIELFKNDPNYRIDMVKLLDYIAGNTAVLLDQTEGATLRRKLYGQAGTFRPTSYGLEYRVLSNFWMKSPYLMQYIIGLCREAITHYFAGNKETIFNLVDPSDIIMAINNNDKALAWKNWNKIKGFLTHHYTEDSAAMENIKVMEFISMKGVDNHLPVYYDGWNLRARGSSHGNVFTNIADTRAEIEKEPEYRKFRDSYNPNTIYM